MISINTIQFISPQHEQNFKETLVRWPKARKDAEYAAACYVFAIPMIYGKFRGVNQFEYPISWIYDFLYPESSEDGITVRVAYDLTSSMIQLGRFALNMWSGYQEFNLHDCLIALDQENYEAIKTAMDIRKRLVSW